MNLPPEAEALLEEIRTTSGPFMVSRVVMRLQTREKDADALCRQIRDVAESLGVKLPDS